MKRLTSLVLAMVLCATWGCGTNLGGGGGNGSGVGPSQGATATREDKVETAYRLCADNTPDPEVIDVQFIWMESQRDSGVTPAEVIDTVVEVCPVFCTDEHVFDSEAFWECTGVCVKCWMAVIDAVY